MSAAGAAARARPDPELRLVGLTKRYGARCALDGLDLELAGPQLVGVLGPDGAGKTTLLRSIAGLLEVEAREATVLGHDLRGDVRALKAAVGYVPQVFALHRELSVFENLRFTARLHRLPAARFEPLARELLERTGLAPFAGRPTGALSGGMKHKLAVANALLPGPALLALDEPTAGVDVLARGEILELLAERRGAALILLATSYLDEAARCDRLVYLDAGRALATGTPDELRARVGLAVYRLWGPAPRAIARAARALPWVLAARAAGLFARVEVDLGSAPAGERVAAALAQLGEAAVRLVEPLALDVEASLLALARRAAGPASRAAAGPASRAAAGPASRAAAGPGGSAAAGPGR